MTAELRIGHGVDAHRLVAGRALWLGCVRIEHEAGLLGHSDGDVASHALCSALLGGAALGTMGDRFPSTEPRWDSAPGRRFLEETALALQRSGLRVVSAQVVIVCERPRLRPYLPGMESALNAGLGVTAGTVTVGVTSTDGLGATGRGEGIAATAVALLAPIS